MTTLITDPSQTDSLAFSDWDSLPAAEHIPDTTPDTALPTPEKTPPGTCEACGEIIVREPGARGRMPKYHPACRPLKSATTRAPSAARSGRAEAEAAQLTKQFQGGMLKLIAVVAMADRYDGFVMLVGLPGLCSAFNGMMLKYDSWRRKLIDMQGEGSVIAFMFSLASIVFPIAAHHGFIPSKQITQMLTNLPMAMRQMQIRMEEGAAGMATLMDEQMDKLKAAQEAERKRRTEPVVASAS